MCSVCIKAISTHASTAGKSASNYAICILACVLACVNVCAHMQTCSFYVFNHSETKKKIQRIKILFLFVEMFLKPYMGSCFINNYLFVNVGLVMGTE